MNLTEIRKPLNSLALGAVALCVLSLSGCAGATRLPARTHGPSGQNFEAKQLDLHFLEEGGARREEVLQRLGPIDTGYSNPRLFWGRWSNSKWGYWWFVAAQGGAAGDAKRVWHAHNVLVTFDESGLAQKKMVFDDDTALWRELHAQLAELPPLDLSQPVPMGLAKCCWLTEMTLTRDSIHITRSKKKDSTADVSPQKIARISHNRVPDKGSSVGITCHTLHLAEKSAMGKSIHFCAAAPSVVAMFQYLQQTAPGSLQWE